MADTDLPNGFGAIDRPSGPSRAPRPIASPFGMLPTDGLTSPPGPPPGFNVQPEQPATNPMDWLSRFGSQIGDQLAPARVAGNLGSALMSSPGANYWTPPNRWTPAAEIMGAPVDAMALTLRHFGLPIPGETQPNGSWRPSVPLGTKSIQDSLNTLDNVSSPISLDALLRALRRPGLF
jgi:hypothetical protein